MLMDMFSGCGGMSTGFRSANGLGPIFDIRGAVDIDPVANRTRELRCKDKSTPVPTSNNKAVDYAAV